MKNKLLSIVVAVAMMVSCVCEASAAFVNDTIIDGSPTSGEGRIDNVLPDEELLNNDSTFTFSELSDSKKYYSVTPDDPEWENFSTSKEMIEACAIPASQLEKMSTYELADAVLAFPLLMDIYFFNDIDMALKNLSKRSDAYSALLQREDAMEVMESVYKTMQSSRDTDELMLHTMELLLSDVRVIGNEELTGSPIGLLVMATDFEVSITYFENYAADGDSLSADKREDVSVLPGSNAALTESGLTVSGQGEKGKAFDVSVSIESGAFVNPRDWNENYDVLSVLDLESFVRFVLKEKDANNMLYVDVRFSGEAGKKESYENYNTDWYTAFVSSDIVLEEEVALPGVRDTTSSTRRSYSTTNNIYGDIYKEYIQIEAIADYPSVINNQTGGLFCFTLGIKDKWTVYTPYGGSRVTTDGSSLGVNCGEINLSTPQGEYFSSMQTDFQGQIFSRNNPLSLGFNLNIPSTPFSLTYSYAFAEDYYTSSFFKAYPGTKNKATQVGNIWESEGYWIYAAPERNSAIGDFFYVAMRVDTVTSYQVFGRKALNYRWDYHITGTGINENYGIAVDMPSEYDYIEGTVPYTLIAA